LILYTDVVTNFAVGLTTIEKIWNDSTFRLVKSL